MGVEKIYPNDPCPCGSGKKYKKCCGAVKKGQTEQQYEKTNLVLEDFVLKRLEEDISFIQKAIQQILGHEGYLFCKKNEKELAKAYAEDGLHSYISRDGMELHSMEVSSDVTTISSIQPYGGGSPEFIEDILSLLQKDKIYLEGRQVELFHGYLMENLRKRFKDYMYVPDESVPKNRDYGAFARRGYDFLLGITLYIELQLGVHIYLNITNPLSSGKEFKKSIIDFYGLDGIKDKIDSLETNMYIFLADYAELLGQLASEYNAMAEVELYNSLGLYDREDVYENRKQLLKIGTVSKGYDFNYISYLRYIISATCFNLPGYYMAAIVSFPQCDFAKYLYGLESIVELFEEKVDGREIDPAAVLNLESVQDMMQPKGITINTKKHKQTRKDIYDTTVFWLMDELNGSANHTKPVDFHYKDFGEINENERTMHDGLLDTNPARKSTSIYSIRKLKMEIYNMLNGKFFTLMEVGGNRLGSKPKMIGKYTILPWLSSGMENTVHTKPFNRTAYNIEDIFSIEREKRQAFLTLEYRLTTIPVNCIEEFLNPDVFYNWEERNELLKEVKKQNEELKVVNDSLNRHIELNQELVRNLSHSSANYLNSTKLAQTGVELHAASENDPSLDQLHMDGLSLMLQSQQEMFLSRQLNSLVWRCSADVEALQRQIRTGLSKEEGASVISPIEFALKNVIARVLFRENDRRSIHIQEKLDKDELEFTKLKSSFMLDVLANQSIQEGCVLSWWRQNISSLDITTTKVWESLRIIKEKSFFDLITEIVTELVLNALSHGDFSNGIKLIFGQAEEKFGRPAWTYIQCENICGERFQGGRNVGISTLNEMILQLNNEKRGVEVWEENQTHATKVWLLGNMMRTID